MFFGIAILSLIISFFISNINNRYKKSLIIVNLIISIIYVIWRVTVIPTNTILNTFLGITLFSAELIGLMQFCTFQFLFFNEYTVVEKTIDDIPNESLPTVDILICTYNESVKLLEKTLVATLKLNYPQDKITINICDDGKRLSVKHLCDKYGVNWITREDNAGAKAGNINNALKQLKGELFAVLDADMIPTKKFLEKTVGYFFDENTAFVQTPQAYYNQDVYQFNLNRNIPNEQDFFMRNVQEGRAAINAVLHVGTNAVFRRCYVEAIGGYPTCSITEDMAVGMQLQEKGYRTVFINEVLVLGLSANVYSDLIQQRDRWCRGNLQVMKQYNPLFSKNLSWKQKIAYIDGVLYWFTSIQKMIFIIIPMLHLLTGTMIIDSNVSQLLTLFLPFLIGQIFIFKSLSSNVRTLRWSHIYEISMAPHISFSILKEILGLKIKFNVTPKDTDNDKGYFQFKAAAPHIVLLCLSILALSIGIYRLNNNSINFGSIILNSIWCLYNLYAIIVSIRVSYQKPTSQAIESLEKSKGITFEAKSPKNICANDYVISDFSTEEILIQYFGIEKLKTGDKILVKLKDNISVMATINAYLSNKNYRLLLDKNTDIDIIKEFGELYIENIKPFYDVNINQRYTNAKTNTNVIKDDQQEFDDYEINVASC